MYLDYFPYEALRPYQDVMLDSVYDTVRRGEHGVLMIDAPTGSGKTSCIAAALAAAPGKIIVAVRTVSQIDIYLDEIVKIWNRTRHRPEIAYMVGKQKICPLEGELRGESIYSACLRLRDSTKSFMSERLKESHNNIYDPGSDKSRPDEVPGNRTFCPYYLLSREAFLLNGKAYFKHSDAMLNVVEMLKSRVHPPEKLLDACEGVCPYEVMSLLAKSSNLIILNYTHLFSPDFQNIIFEWLELEPETLTLFVDEAHNLGDAVRALNTRFLTPRMVDLAEREVDRYEEALGQMKLLESRLEAKRRLAGIEVIRTLLPRLRKFMESREARMREGQALLDMDIFRAFIYREIDDIDFALSCFSDVAVSVAELKLAEGDRENLQGDIEPSLASVLLFLSDLERSQADSSYQSRIVVTEDESRRRVRLEVNNIDPAEVIRKVVDNVNATVMLSGTLSPMDAYQLYCLGEENRARMLSLPNPFPAENRLLLAAKNATSQLDKREDMENRREIAGHIEAIIECVSGNVAIFFTSYAMMNQYSSICKKAARHARKKLYLEPRSAEEVPQVLDDFFACGTKKGAVLLGVSGGKLAEGIDYKGEALNGVAVVGLPLAVYNDIQREINGYYVRKYGREKGMLIAYTLPAINRGMQAGGRVIRDQSERGVILFCDRRFNDGSRAGVRRYLPEWIQSELVATDAAGSRRIIEEKQREWARG